MPIEFAQQADVTQLVEIPVVLELDGILGGHEHRVREKPCTAAIPIRKRVDSHGFSVHGDAQLARRPVVSVLPAIPDVVECVAQFDRDLLGCDPDVDFVLPPPALHEVINVGLGDGLTERLDDVRKQGGQFIRGKRCLTVPGR
jgi:hypothetical protein